MRTSVSRRSHDPFCGCPHIPMAAVCASLEQTSCPFPTSATLVTNLWLVAWNTVSFSRPCKPLLSTNTSSRVSCCRVRLHRTGRRRHSACAAKHLLPGNVHTQALSRRRRRRSTGARRRRRRSTGARRQRRRSTGARRRRRRSTCARRRRRRSTGARRRRRRSTGATHLSARQMWTERNTL